MASGQALVPLTSGFFAVQRRAIVDMTLQQRLPTIFASSVWADLGGLLSYGPDFSASYRRAAEMVVKLLGGANPAEMPVEQPNVVEMVLNMKTAKALGVVVPPTIRLRAERVIE